MDEMRARETSDLARVSLQLLALGALIATSFWILRPFLLPLLWAAMIVAATWPLMATLQTWLGGRRALAVAVMTIALLLVLVVPLYLGITSIVGHSGDIAGWSESLATLKIPAPPEWLTTLPLVGARIEKIWHTVEASRPEEIASTLEPYARSFGLWIVGQVGSVGLLLVQFLLTVGISAILYSNGEAAASSVQDFARRLAGRNGENAVTLAAQAIRAVALGVVVTAILQSALAGLGLAVVGVQFAAILTALIFVLAVAQIGPGPVMLPVVFWVYFNHGAGWGTAFLVWSIFCGTFDGFVRPALIKRGADLPFLLIFAGVVGGLIAFGVVGLFVGPVVLAVGHALLTSWVYESDLADGSA